MYKDFIIIKLGGISCNKLDLPVTLTRVTHSRSDINENTVFDVLQHVKSVKFYKYFIRINRY